MESSGAQIANDGGVNFKRQIDLTPQYQSIRERKEPPERIWRQRRQQKLIQNGKCCRTARVRFLNPAQVEVQPL